MDERQLLFQHAAHSRFTRRRLLRNSAVAAGALVGAGASNVGSAFGSNGADPKPVPGGFNDDFSGWVPSNPIIHAGPPGIVFDGGKAVHAEMATVTDFNGFVAAAELGGTANGGEYVFDCDMRFMSGVYAGEDNKLRRGSFGFV